MQNEMLTPDNTTIVLIDFAVGFANVLRSHDLKTHLNNVVALAKVGVEWKSGLVITSGIKTKPTGPLYPQVTEVIGDRPVIERAEHYNAFLDKNFRAAVEATGRRKLAIAGISTEGCVVQSVLGALREDYEVFVIADCCASISRETHDLAIMRMVQAGAIPISWFSLSGEFLVDQTAPQAAIHQKIMAEHVPEMAMGVKYFLATKELAKSEA